MCAFECIAAPTEGILETIMSDRKYLSESYTDNNNNNNYNCLKSSSSSSSSSSRYTNSRTTSGFTHSVKF